MDVVMSNLPKTWILDLDGTILKHNGYKIDGRDSLLPGYEKLLNQIALNDMVIFVTSREEKYREMTERFLDEHGIRHDVIIYGAPYGERIIVNDNKPSGLKMSYAFSPDRDIVEDITIVRDENL